MTEIEKMFEKAGIKCLHPSGFCKHIGATCEVCERHKYPPFTAEKQLKIIKWLGKHTYRNYIKFRFDICGLWYCECNMSNSDMHHTFEDALIDVLMQIWQDLTDQEKEEIRNILK